MEPSRFNRRVWHIEDQEMVYEFDGHSCCSWYDFFWDVEENIRMQSTGLLDKNNVEIFEGDILFADWGLQAGTGEVYTKMVVVKADQSPCSCGTYVFPGLGFDSYNPPEDFIVIGNKYENPELLPNQ